VTPEERAHWVYDKWLNGDYLETSLVEALAAVIREEIAAEREACAQIADSWSQGADTVEGWARRVAAIAVEIRARP
jgi:hypothetical protein